MGVEALGARWWGLGYWGGGGGGIPDISGVPDVGWSSQHGLSSRHGMEFQTWDGVPDMGGVPDMEWGSRHGVGYQTQVGFLTWDDGVPDRWWGTRQGWVKKGNLSFSEFSNVRFNLTSRGFNLTSHKIISFTSRGNLTSHESGILHSLIFVIFCSNIRVCFETYR